MLPTNFFEFAEVSLHFSAFLLVLTSPCRPHSVVRTRTHACRCIMWGSVLVCTTVSPRLQFHEISDGDLFCTLLSMIGPGPPPKSNVTSASTSTPTRPGMVTVKVRAGGSGQSSLALKMKEEKVVSNGRMPETGAVASTASTASGSKPAVPTVQSSKPAVPSQQHKIVIAARHPPTQAERTAAAAPPAQPAVAPVTTSTASAASTSSPSKVTSPPGLSTSKTSSSTSSKNVYENPVSYQFTSEHVKTETPNGISLDLSGDRAGPQLLAIKSRSDRLRAACLAEDKHEVVNLLGQGTDPNQVDAYGNTALMLAASTGNADVVDELLSHGANVQLKDNYGQTALIFACSKGHYEVAKMLVDRKAGVNVTTSHGQTALMKVCYISHPHTGILAELLLTHKAKPDTQTADGTTAAMVAAQNDHMELLEILAHYSASLDLRRTSDGWTTLHIAAAKCSFTMVANLIGLGADPQVKNAAGRTCLELTPLTSQNGSAPMPLAEYQRKMQKAVDRGMALREEMAERQREHAEIRRKLAEERAEKRRLALLSSKLAEGLSSVQAQKAVDESLGEGAGKVTYVDDEGVEHYSRPASAKMTADELKAKTYKPQIDPRSVFGDAPEPTPATSSSSYVSTQQQPPESYNDALDDEGGDSEDEMIMISQHD
jgi:ankyrin repeat protein